MNGLGFMVWRVADVDPDIAVMVLKQMGAKWISVKVLDGEVKVNQTGGNDKTLLAWIKVFRDAGIAVGGWGYVYTARCGPQGAAAAERIEKLDLEHWMIDAEGEWQRPSLGKSAELYCGSIDVNLKFPVYLCSYRFPQQHVPFPFGSFLHHEKVKGTAPQVYWAGAHNPVTQVVESEKQYLVFSEKDFFPIGATFGATFASATQAVGTMSQTVELVQPDVTIREVELQNREGLANLDPNVNWEAAALASGAYWEPTAEDLQSFTAYCKAHYSAYGYYSLDWPLKHGKADWFRAIALGNGAVVTPEPPPPAADVIKPLWYGKVATSQRFVNLRNAPDPVLSKLTDIGDVLTGSVLPVVEERGKWSRVEGWVQTNLLRKT